jgi:GT2 family glycosyltransferase
MKISFNLLTFNSSSVLKESIFAILDSVSMIHIPEFKYEINILNNGSTDGTESTIKAFQGNINYFRNTTNKSFSSGFNFLLKNATPDFDIYCILSDDIILNKNSIKYLIEFYSVDENKNTIVAPKSILPNKTLDKINKKKLDKIDLLFGFTILGNLLKIRNEHLSQEFTCFSEVVQDSCLFFSRGVKKEFYFDEDYKFYFTEDSLSNHLINNNFLLKYVTEIQVEHYLKQATKKIKNTKMNFIYFRDCKTYSKKNNNFIFHYLLFLPIMNFTILTKYFKWKYNSKHYV